jgi:hypothetical protein
MRCFLIKQLFLWTSSLHSSNKHKFSILVMTATWPLYSSPQVTQYVRSKYSKGNKGCKPYTSSKGLCLIPYKNFCKPIMFSSQYVQLALIIFLRMFSKVLLVDSTILILWVVGGDFLWLTMNFVIRMAIVLLTKWVPWSNMSFIGHPKWMIIAS